MLAPFLRPPPLDATVVSGDPIHLVLDASCLVLGPLASLDGLLVVLYRILFPLLRRSSNPYLYFSSQHIHTVCMGWFGSFSELLWFQENLHPHSAGSCRLGLLPAVVNLFVCTALLVAPGGISHFQQVLCCWWLGTCSVCCSGFEVPSSILCNCMLWGNAVCVWSLNNGNVAILHGRRANMMSVPCTSAARVEILPCLRLWEALKSAWCCLFYMYYWGISWFR